MSFQRALYLARLSAKGATKLGLIRLAASLRRHRRIALDTSVFIYQVEANPRYIELTDRVFEWIEAPGNMAVTSTITMTELLVDPYRDSS